MLHYQYILEAVKKRIKETVPEIAHVEIYCNQFDNYTQIPQHQFPAVYVDFSQEVSVKGGAMGVAFGEMKVRLHVVNNSLEYEDLNIFKLANLVHANIQGINADVFTPFDLLAFKFTTGHTNLYTQYLDYSTTLTDDSAMEEGSEVIVEEFDIQPTVKEFFIIKK